MKDIIKFVVSASHLTT